MRHDPDDLIESLFRFFLNHIVSWWKVLNGSLAMETTQG
jgi:hypothetical protein